MVGNGRNIKKTGVLSVEIHILNLYEYRQNTN
jgi:hypothetical protein